MMVEYSGVFQRASMMSLEIHWSSLTVSILESGIVWDDMAASSVRCLPKTLQWPGIHWIITSHPFPIIVILDFWFVWDKLFIIPMVQCHLAGFQQPFWNYWTLSIYMGGFRSIYAIVAWRAGCSDLVDVVICNIWNLALIEPQQWQWPLNQWTRPNHPCKCEREVCIHFV